MKPTVHVVGGCRSTERLFLEAGYPSAGLRDADMFVFTGGEDVDPSLYNELPLARTTFNPARDKYEMAVYELTGRKLKVGICRGAQFLNVMNGGKLWQHVEGHQGNIRHSLQYIDESTRHKTYTVNSEHHQMMVPQLSSAQIWGWAGAAKSKQGFETMVTCPLNHQMDVEIVFYPRSNSFCFQPHPEWGHSETTALFEKCMERLLNR